VRQEIVDLDGAEREQGQHLEVDSAAQRGGKGVLRGTACDERTSGGGNGFMSTTDKEMRERRDGTGEAKLRADEISFQTRAGALKGAGGVTEIRSERERPKHLVGAANMPAIEIEILSGGIDDATSTWARGRWSQRESDRRPHERVAAEKLNVLSARRRCYKQERENSHTNKREDAHSGITPQKQVWLVLKILMQRQENVVLLGAVTANSGAG
jgi:hypothetical protein